MKTEQLRQMKPITFNEFECDLLLDKAEEMVEDLESQREGTSPEEIEQLELDICFWYGIATKMRISKRD